MQRVSSARRRAPGRLLPAGLPLVFLLAILLIWPGAGGCKEKSKGGAATQPSGNPSTEPTSLPATVSGELSGSLAALYDPAVPPASFSYMGIRIGDPDTSLNKPDVTSGPDPSGWIGYKNHDNTFRVENGKVMDIQITEPSVLSTLGLTSEASIMERFGKPEKPPIEDPADARYDYKSRWLTILWSRTSNTPKAVIISYAQ